MKKLIILIIVFVIFVASIGAYFVFQISSFADNKPIPKEPVVYPQKFLHVEGKKVVDENGNEVILRGFNIGSFKFASYKDLFPSQSLEKINVFNDQNYKYYLTEEDIKDMKEMGANVLRAHSYMKFWTLETEPYQFNEGFVKTLDDLIDVAYRNGIYVIIDLTEAGQNEPQNENSFGNTLWTDQDLEQRVIAGWKYLAGHYANNPGVAGYDILNEPSPPTNEKFHSFYATVIKEIREVDKNHIIILDTKHFPLWEEGIRWGGEYDDDNIMLTTHHYDDALEKYESNPSLARYDTKEEIEQGIKESLSWPELQNRPFFIGEFSALWDTGERGLQWTQDTIDLMNQYGIHWTYFSYKNIFGTKRGLYVAKELWLKDATEEQIKNLELGEKQRRLLSTEENYEINQRIKETLENGFKR
ncbi:hypothetical protein COU58_02085 [Candidatus Pacearchaeota archaeon CG10_big_fil_rev_8_21_14_0_10_32_42]|nr:MAG: hypothetical protein COU58_02085 [Candidatus Pacearchaeota archaeon CG10_big_fil_rev_8_21_14_0_10_32_42]